MTYDIDEHIEKILEKRKDTLFINTWSSECGNCNKGANPNEKSHLSVLGYGKQGKGCGVTWKYISSGYPENVISNKNLKEMRPDLLIDRTII